MRKQNVYMDDDQHAGLEQLAAQTGQPVAKLIRRAIALFLLIHQGEGGVAQAMGDALKTFDDADSPERALIRQLLHWHHGHEENSVRGIQRRMEASLARVEEKLGEIDGRLRK